MKQTLYDMLVAYIVQEQNKFYRLAYSYVKNQEDALDVVQNAVCRALENYDSLRDEKAVKTWFYKILVNECFALLKAKKRMVLSEDDSYWEIPYEEEGYEIHDDLHIQIGQMEKDVQTIIKLRFFEELTLEEISRVLEINLNTVKAKLYRGLKTLRVAIGKERGA